MLIGILGLQGDVQEHITSLQRLDVSYRIVKTPAELAGLDGLILPGGESTTLTKLIRLAGLETPVKDLIAKGLPVWGTCAGTILLCQGGIWQSLTAEVSRNAYGPQLYSCIKPGAFQGAEFPMVFIRAPKILKAGAGEDILATCGPDITALRKNNLIVSTFHPELTQDDRFLQYFLDMAAEYRATQATPCKHCSSCSA